MEEPAGGLRPVEALRRLRRAAGWSLAESAGGAARQRRSRRGRPHVGVAELELAALGLECLPAQPAEYSDAAKPTRNRSVSKLTKLPKM